MHRSFNRHFHPDDFEENIWARLGF
uniref:Uncharacterized protein n=1 Tax=Anguilla anguilla TaxID=7936 RepID=A0A0E9ULD1_ANGAN